jgi:hypothetical protein
VPVSEQGYDFNWLISNGAGAAWQYAFAVQAHLEDADAAEAAQDWPLCVEACHLTLHAVLYVYLVMTGHVGRRGDIERHLNASLDPHPAARALRELPLPPGASREDAAAARALADKAVAEVRALLPLEVPVVRSPGGYYPTVRIGADIERLRERAGLGGLDWYQWAL